MPQVNEYSWILNSFNMMFIFLLISIFTLMNFGFKSQNHNNLDILFFNIFV